MSVKSDIASYANTVNNSLSLTDSDISDSMVSSAWEDSCDAVKGQTSSITDRNTSGLWSVTDKENFALTHFPTSIQTAITSGKAVIPYRSTITGYEARVVITNNKVYKFPTNNVNYFNSAVANVKYYGAARYFGSVNATSNQTTSTNAGNTAVANYNYSTN
jgi:hypothetical protein